MVSFDVTLVSGERRSVELHAGPIDRNPNARAAPSHWTSIGREALWLKDPETPFHTHWFADAGALYVQLNQVLNAEDQTIAAFGQAVLDQLSQRQARSIIIDLRHNNGGDNDFVFDFVRAIDRYVALERDGSIIVLIGPRTFSASMEVAGRLERDMNALFVGWPTGGRPNVYGTERPFRLPYAGISGTIPVQWRQDGMSGNDERPWIPPDYAVWPTLDDVLNGRDPVLDRALAVAAQ